MFNSSLKKKRCEGQQLGGGAVREMRGGPGDAIILMSSDKYIYIYIWQKYLPDSLEKE